MLYRSAFTKSGSTTRKLNIARIVENSIACCFLKVFFSTIADMPAKRAQRPAKMYHSIAYFLFLVIYMKYGRLVVFIL